MEGFSLVDFIKNVRKIEPIALATGFKILVSWGRL